MSKLSDFIPQTGAIELIGLTDTPSTYDNGKFLQSTTSGAEWAVASGTGDYSQYALIDGSRDFIGNITVTSGNKVGIGLSPNYLDFEIYGDSSDVYDATDKTPTIGSVGQYTYNLNQDEDTYSSIWLGTRDEAVGTVRLSAISKGANVADFSITSNNGTLTSSERLRIKGGTGYIGIGTDNPQHSLDINGDVSISGTMLVPDGSYAVPSYSFINDTDTGIYLRNADEIGFTAGGKESVSIGANTLHVIGDTNGDAVIRLSADGGSSSGDLFRITGGAAPNEISFDYYSGGWQKAVTIDSNSLTVSGALLAQDGTAGSPSVSFANDTDTGIYRYSENQIGFSSEGQIRAIINNNGIYSLVGGSAAVPSIRINDDDTGIYRLNEDEIGFAAAGIHEMSLAQSGVVIEDNLVVKGDLLVSGTRFFTDVETVEIADNLLLLNKGEVGAGVTAGYGGIAIDRGSEDNYHFLFDEVQDNFRVGVSGTGLQAVSTREDSPWANYVPYWNDTDKRFDTISGSIYHKSDGNVGIGTDNPLSKLEVKSIGVSTAPLTIKRSSDTNNLFYLFEDSTGDAMVRGMDSADNVGFEFHSNDNSYLNGGGLGINTNSLKAKLHINTNSNYKAVCLTNSTISGVSKGAAILGDRKNNTDNVPFTGFATWDEGTERRVYLGGGGWNTPDATDIMFYTTTSYTETNDQGIERMRIDPAGNVGIGTTTPSKTLVVQSNVGSAEIPNGILLENTISGSDSQIYMYAHNDADALRGAWIKFDPDERTLSFSANASGDNMTIDVDGNVGIGTTDPYSPLEVNDTTAGSNDLLYLSYNNAVDSGGSLEFGASNARYGKIESYIDAPGNASLRFYDYSSSSLTETMRIRGGNIGIRETNPNYGSHNTALSISSLAAGVGARSALELEGNSVNANGTVQFYNDGVLASEVQNRGEGASGRLSFRQNDVDTMTVKNGNVGIGTTSPGAMLHVAGPSGGDVGIIIEDQSVNVSDSMPITWKSGASTFAKIDAFVSAANDVDLRFFTTTDGGTNVLEQMRITDDGKVGIGTTSPDTKLEVNGDITCNDIYTASGTVYIGDLKLTSVNGTTLKVDNLDVTGNLNATTISGAGAAADRTGEIILLPHGTVDTSYCLECNGASLSQTTYSALFAKIGTTYGHGTVSGTTFSLPDYRGQFMRFWDHGAGVEPSADRTARTDRGDGTTGDYVGTKQIDEFKSHAHKYWNAIAAGIQVYAATPSTVLGVYEDSGSTGGTETRPVNVNLMPCIIF